eukprot:2591282-Amphidinium_carterae.1
MATACNNRAASSRCATCVNSNDRREGLISLQDAFWGNFWTRLNMRKSMLLTAGNKVKSSNALILQSFLY